MTRLLVGGGSCYLRDYDALRTKIDMWLTPLPKVIFDSYFYPLSANPTKWFKHTQTICWLLPNCLSVFDHFVMLALKGLTETMTSTLIIGNWAKKLLELSDPEKSFYKGGNTIEVLINLLFTWKINTIRI